MNFNIANMVYWMARMTVRNEITVVTRMTEIKSTKLSTIMQM